MIEKGGLDIETVLLFYAIFGKLVVRPQAFAGDCRDGPKARDEE